MRRDAAIVARRIGAGVDPAAAPPRGGMVTSRPLRALEETRMNRPATLRRHAALFVAILAGAAGAARAQDEFDFRLIRPVVTLSAWGVPDADFQTHDGSYNASTVLLNANIPLGPTHIHPGGKVLGHQFLLGAMASTTTQNIDPLPNDPRLYSGALVFSTLIAGSKGNLYLGSVGGSFAEDEETIHNLDTRVFALGLGSYRTSKEFMFIYGGAYTYLYGRPLLLPAFGIAWTPNPTWSVTGALPFYWRVTQKLTPDLRLHYLLYVVGQRYRFTNDSVFAGQGPVVYERQHESHIGAEIEYKATTDLSLLAQAGIAGGRHLAFSDLDNNDIVDDRIDPAPYIKVSLRYAFGKSLVEEIESRAAGSRAP
jgi:uncharacterized protein DUF6268